MSISLSRKRKKELRRLQADANKLWEGQQVLVGHAADVAREASRQLGAFNREQLVPVVQDTYSRRVAPVVDRGVKAGRHLVDHKVVPVVGGVVGSAMHAWDIANDKRGGLLHHAAPAKKKSHGIGSVVSIILGAAAAAGVLYAAWQALRADDELWVADDPLSTPTA